MEFPGHYKAQILIAIESVDLEKVALVIQFFKDARAHGRKIFVCGNGRIDSMAAEILCEMVKSASFNRPSRFRILALSDQLPKIGDSRSAFANDRVFLEQLKNFAEPEDVVVGICPTGNSLNVVNAIEYASWIGCRTIAVTGGDGGELARLAELAVRVPVTHAGSIEDTHIIICHLIGHYFVNIEDPVGDAAARNR